MMTKTTSHKKALYKALLILPAVAISLLLSCNSVTQDKDTSKATRDTVTKPFGKNLDRQVYRIEHSITPASKQVLDEYAALLEKYNLTGLPPNSLPITQSDEPQSPEAQDKWDQFDIQLKTMLKKVSTTDKARLNELFTKMDSTQQVNQYLIFAPAPIPLAKNSVTAQQLARWGSSKEYLVFIDNKPVPYTKLAKYKPEDFDWGKVNSAVNSQGRKEGFKYKVALLTKPFYADYYNNIMADRSDHMAYHVKTGEKSFWMAYL